MTAADRLQLIRARLGKKSYTVAKPKGLACALTGDTSAAKKYGPVPIDAGKGWGCRNEFGVLLNPEDKRPQWVKEHDPKAGATFRAPPRRGPHHLNKIADKWASDSWREETKRLDLHHA